MSNLWKRVILTNITVPSVLFALFFPINNHIILAILFCFFISFLGSYEISNLIFNKGIIINKLFLPVINSLLFIDAYLWAHNSFSLHSYPFIPYLFFLFIIVSISFVYARDIFASELHNSFHKITYTLFGLLYVGLPSFLFPFILNIDVCSMADVPGFVNVKPVGALLGSLLVLYLLICIWVNDIFAYVFGMTFGKHSKLGLAASPNKSLAGYIGGYITTFIFVAIFYFIFKEELKALPMAFYFITPFITGFLVPIGDLVESVFKRSINIKDSGNIILGRGGVLDSVDTLLFLIPIYFIGLQCIFSIQQFTL